MRYSNCEHQRTCLHILEEHGLTYQQGLEFRDSSLQILNHPNVRRIRYRLISWFCEDMVSLRRRPLCTISSLFLGTCFSLWHVCRGSLRLRWSSIMINANGRLPA